MWEAERRIEEAAASRATVLDLSGLGLTAVPDSVARLSDLTELRLMANSLDSLPEWLGDLSRLEKLDLSFNMSLTVMPDSARRLARLAELSLNGVGAFKVFGRLTALTRLDLSDCGLVRVPDWIRGSTALQELDLSGNSLTELPAWMGGLTALTSLWLGEWSRPMSWGVQTDPFDWTNQLTSLPESFRGLSSLVFLDLDGNRFRTLPEWLGDLPSLRELRLHNNELLAPPPEVVVQGTDAVLSYLRANRRGSTRRWAAKLIVVGEGAVGKTSLVKALSGQAHDPAELTTHGMRIDPLELDHPGEPGVRMSVTAWDFGGQEVYHATHQFFLTDQSLVVLVWNPRTGHRQSRVRYWLDVIAARAPQAPILLVASHADERRPSDLPVDELRARYPMIVGSLTVDSASGTGISALLNEVVFWCAGLPNMGRPWPTAWVRAAQRLTERPEPCVTDREMRRTMAESGIDDPRDQTVLAALLHQIGTVLRHDVDENASDVVVLQPGWLSMRISRLLDSGPVAARGGVVTRADRDREWSDIDPPMRAHLLALMEGYDLAYRITDPVDPSVLAVVPGLLSHRMPDFADRWAKPLAQPGGSELRVRYRLDVLPPGIPSWFIAREHRFTTDTHWRNGVLLAARDGIHLGLLRADPEDATVDLAVRGPFPQGFFEILNDGLNVLLDRYPSLGVTREIPCPCSGPGVCTGTFEYGTLLRRLEHGRPTAECDRTLTPVPIRTLLTGLSPTSRDTDAATVEDVRQIIAESMRVSQRDVLKLIRGTQKSHCPSVFTLIPTDKWRPGKTVYQLRLYCEEPEAWHPLPGDQGCYEIARLDDWLRKYGLAMQRVLTLLSRIVPIVGGAAALAAHELTGQLKQDMVRTQQLLAHHLPTRLGALDESPDVGVYATHRADTDADFRVLRAMMTQLAPDTRWGGLNHVLTPEGIHLYLCDQHAAGYA